MRIKKPALIFAAAGVVLLALALLGHNPDFDPEELARLVAQSDELSRFSRSPKPDYRLLEKTYRDGPQKLVRWMDATLDIEMDDKIHTSLANGAAGSIPHINAQIIDLTVKRVLWEYLRYQVEDPPDAAFAARAEAVVLAFRDIVRAGESWAGLDDALTRRVEELATGLAGPEDTGDALLNALRAGFLLSFLKELDAIEKSRGENFPLALFHSARALQYLHILYRDLSVRDRADAVYVFGEVGKMPREMDLEQIRLRIKRNFHDLRNLVSPGIF